MFDNDSTNISFSQDKIGTSNAIVVESIKTGEAKGYELGVVAKPKSEAELRCEKLTAQVADLTSENAILRKRIAEYEVLLDNVAATPRTRQAIKDAKMTDSIVNGV